MATLLHILQQRRNVCQTAISNHLTYHKRWHVSNANQMRRDIKEKKSILTGARGKYRYVSYIDLNEERKGNKLRGEGEIRLRNQKSELPPHVSNNLWNIQSQKRLSYYAVVHLKLKLRLDSEIGLSLNVDYRWNEIWIQMICLIALKHIVWYDLELCNK